MVESIDLKEIKKLLPHGAIAEIATKAGVLAPTVSRALSGDKRSPKLPEILNATAEYLKEYKAKEADAIQAIKNVLTPESPEQLKERLKEQSEKYGDSKSPLL